jgi:DNA-binding transcriptional MerR regulator
MATWTVGQVADLLGVTVRTLHHYDQIGLLVPSGRSTAGYRLYTDVDLARLQQVVVYRRLELPLDEIRALLDGGEDALDHLRRQRAAVMDRLGELTELVAAIDRALEREMSEQPATPEELRELFGDGFSDEYEAEAQERWGESHAWKQSAARTKRYTKADWVQVKAEMDAVNRAFVAAKQRGEPATSEAAMDAAEQHRRHIRGSTTSTTSSTVDLPTCMSLTRGSRGPTTTSNRGWRSTCGTRSTRTPSATERRPRALVRGIPMARGGRGIPRTGPRGGRWLRVSRRRTCGRRRP